MMKHFNLSIPWLTASLSSLIIAVYFILGPVPDLLIYDQQLFKHHQLWKLASAHFVHSDHEHLIWNIAALLILGGLLEIRSRKLLIGALMAGIVGVDLLLIANPAQIHYFAGLSGILNSLLVTVFWCFLIEHKKNHQKCRLILISSLLCLGKIVVEISIDGSLFTRTAWSPLPQSHLAGFLAGLIYSYWLNRTLPADHHFILKQSPQKV
jgi:rhomboid family GlyGly-CTERM serine protease